MEFNQQTPSGQSGNQPGHKPGNYFKGISLLIIVVIVYFLGYQTGHKGYIFEPTTFKVVNQKDQTVTVDYQLLWDALKEVNEKYIDKPVDQQKMLYGAISGALESLGDPYTVFLPPKELQTFQSQLKGSFGGIGAEVGIKNGNIVVVAPLADTPAERAGILAGDIVVSVDGQSTAGWTVDEAVSKIRGEKGTAVVLNLFREGRDKPFELKIVRDTILIKSVKLSYKEVEKDGQKQTVAVITLSAVGDDTQELFDEAVNEILTKNVSGLVIDVRNNPGGYLQTAVDLASSWVKSGEVVVTEEHSDGTAKKHTAQGTTRLSGFKTVVLINGGSASASEILAGALKDHGHASLVGEKSFGKGSVQELINLSGKSAVKITVAKWITPSGKNLNKEGLHPDVEVKLTEEDIKEGKDPQMEKALEEVIK